MPVSNCFWAESPRRTVSNPSQQRTFQHRSPGENRSLFYHDANQNGQYDPAEDIWKDEDGGTAAQYDAGTDTLVYRGTDGTWQLQGGEAGAQAGLLYHDADRSGSWDAGEDLFVETANPEPHSVNADPVFASGKYFTNSPTSPIIAAGTAGAGGVFCIPDANGWLRHVSTPSIGAYEYVTETATATFGRITTRNLGGRTYHYAYCADGHIASYTDDQDASSNATYEYDFLGRRIRMTVGDSVTRMVYDGDDVVAEYIDENGDGTLDRKRVYWILPVIDQRIGFVDIDVETGAKKFYYYLTDQVGSVMQVVDDAGTVVNQYDYDAFGNLNTDGSFETVPNRYRFQGREYDAHRGDYYFRNRTYIPDWGCFTGPDRRFELEANGPCNHLFAANNPLRFMDPEGLSFLTKLFKSSAERLSKEALTKAGGKALSREAKERILKSALRETMEKAFGDVTKSTMFRLHHCITRELVTGSGAHNLFKHIAYDVDRLSNRVVLPFTREGQELLVKKGLKKAASHSGRHLDEYVQGVLKRRLDEVYRTLEKAGFSAEAREAATESVTKLEQELQENLITGELVLQNADKNMLAVGGIALAGMNMQQFEALMDTTAGDEKWDEQDRFVKYMLAECYTGDKGVTGWIGKAVDFFNPADDVRTVTQLLQAGGCAVRDTRAIAVDLFSDEAMKEAGQGYKQARENTHFRNDLLERDIFGGNK